MSELREELLRVLGVGEWEAETLTTADLVRRLVELADWYDARLRAASAESQRLACDVQELLGGEALERQREELFRLGEEVAELATENWLMRRLLAEGVRS